MPKIASASVRPRTCAMPQSSRVMVTSWLSQAAKLTVLLKASRPKRRAERACLIIVGVPGVAVHIPCICMSEKPSPEEAALWRRRLASQANNRAWTLAESLSRTPDEDEEMLQAAHAAMYFWKIVGNSRNQAHAAQLVAHVYALLGQGQPARHYQAKSQSVLLGE